MTNKRQLSDEAILKTFQEAAAAHEELLSTVGKLKAALTLMSERLDLLQQKVLDLERRQRRARR